MEYTFLDLDGDGTEELLMQWQDDPASYNGQLKPILSNGSIFGSDLMANGLGEKIEKIFVEELAGPGAVRATLKKYLA